MSPFNGSTILFQPRLWSCRSYFGCLPNLPKFRSALACDKEKSRIALQLQSSTAHTYAGSPSWPADSITRPLSAHRVMAKRSRQPSVTAQDSPLRLSPDLSAAMEPIHTPKYFELDQTPSLKLMSPLLQCTLPPHKPMNFASYQDYEAHYNSSHTNRCRECQKNFPSSHFLDLHLAEHHDPIVAAKREKGEKTFACFVEGCDRVCLEWKKRRSHLVDKHGFPKNYDFFVVNNGIDGRSSMLRPGIDAQGHRKSSRERRGSSATEITQMTEATTATTATTATYQTDATDIDERDLDAPLNPAARPFHPGDSLDQITKSMSSLNFVPRSITFGRRKGKSGLAKS